MVADGKIKRLAVSLPPRAGKSYLASLFSAWLLGRNPSGSVMRNCCTATLYNKFSYDTRDICRSERYQQTFPNLKLSDDKQSVVGWNTIEAMQVSYFGAGVGGTIIGFGASLMAITDDLFRSFEDAISETIRDRTHSWYQGTHVSRTEKGCASIDIGTRWSKRDIIGQNIDQGYYDHIISVPAIDEHGNSFCEAVKTTSEYQDVRKYTSKEIWMAEYMQEPIESAGALFSRDEIKRFSLAELRRKITPVQLNGSKEPGAEVTPDQILGYIDVADEGTDRLAFPLGVIIGDRVYITDIILSAENIDITLPLCIEQIRRTRCDYIRVEGNNQGSAMIKMLRGQVSPEKILKVTNTANKHSRILMQYGFIKEHFYFIRDSEIQRGSEYELFLHELFEYTKAGTSKRDDAPDSAAGLAKFIGSFLPHLFHAESQEA